MSGIPSKNSKSTRSKAIPPLFLKMKIGSKELALVQLTLKILSAKHIMRLKFIDVPVKAKQVPIGPKRKRGQPAKAKRALLTQ